MELPRTSPVRHFHQNRLIRHDFRRLGIEDSTVERDVHAVRCRNVDPAVEIEFADSLVKQAAACLDGRFAAVRLDERAINFDLPDRLVAR